MRSMHEWLDPAAIVVAYDAGELATSGDDRAAPAFRCMAPAVSRIDLAGDADGLGGGDGRREAAGDGDVAPADSPPAAGGGNMPAPAGEGGRGPRPRR